MKIRKIFLSLCIAIIPLSIFAQDVIIGAKFGIGQSVYKKQSDNSDKQNYFTQKYGLSVEFSPYFSKFLIVSGAEYELNELENGLLIPLALRIVIGTSFRGFVEGGGYYGINLKDKSEEFLFENDFGVKVGVGFQYKINRNWIIEAAYFGRFGLTPRMKEEIYLPGNQVQYENYSVSSHQFELSLKYRF